MAVSRVLVPMRVTVHIIAVTMGMTMHTAGVGAHAFNRAKSRPQIKCAEQDQHERDAEFEAHSETLGHDDAKEYDRAADGEESQAVADSPENAGPGRAPDVSLPAHDRGDGDNVIGVCRVAHPEEKTEKQNGNERRHGMTCA